MRRAGVGAGHMTDYAFKVGQMVHYRTQLYSGAARGLYQITQLMPAEDGEFKYRIKSPHEDHERVAKESELSSV
jgi:hypothetical protein